MKIAITGHSAGIGLALSEEYTRLGHEIIGLSRRTGHNIRSVGKIAELIEPADIFINNAQVGFAQTELLFEVFRRWQGKPGKKIINISTMMAGEPRASMPGLDMAEYRVQKVALEEAITQLRTYHYHPQVILLRPGGVATQPGDEHRDSHVEVQAWARRAIQILDTSDGLMVQDFSLGRNY
jgi:NAD(P)-dependent dehydrogenase (short-subunit alcohol dehydrogenase family)